MSRILYLFITLILFTSSGNIKYKEVATFSTNNFVNAVIEIPAGTNHKIEFDENTNTFPCDQKNGKDRIIDFLPYPGNYGFIPSTLMDESTGGDGDALDILVISESFTTGTIVEIVPIAILELKDRGELDSKIIGIPADPANQLLQATTFDELSQKYPQVKNIIETWFLHYKGIGKMELISWGDEKVAMSEIKKFMIKK
ncbi:MAG: inorganic pyrophosphatase [Flavobacteriales bacterium]|nr:inorganic diphosphatase [Bacteroidia bacterium]PCJ81138.1 MAG: inorganic pyrophosphatase [Flavobacteriales bacterium]